MKASHDNKMILRTREGSTIRYPDSPHLSNSEDEPMNHQLARASKITNEIIIQEALMRRQGCGEYTACYHTRDNQYITQLVGITGSRSTTKRLPYPPLSEEAPIISVMYIDSEGVSQRIEIECINWSLHIEDISGNRATGWIRKKTPFLIRPFSIRANGKLCTYDAYATGIREDVTNLRHNDAQTGISIELMLSSIHGNQETRLEFGYSQEDNEILNPFMVYTKDIQDEYQSVVKIINHSPQDATTSFARSTNKAKIDRSIAVLMPIYNGFNETLDALDSFSQYYASTQANLSIRFVLGLDNPDNHQLNQEILRRYGGLEKFTILANEKNLGFIGNCNQMFKEVLAYEDILLVNSDIVAPRGNWIERLVSYLDIDKAIGTVTPLSNQASIYSFPIPNREQGTMGHLSIDQIDELLSSTSPVDISNLVDTPSCHGFCTLIAQSRLRLPYLFDQDFGRGYGEENDLSCRVKNMGLRNIAAPNIYVYHHESVSFSSNKAMLLEKNLRILGERYPDYHSQVARYCEADPIRPFRNNAVIAYFKDLVGDRTSVLHISHYRGGGTDKFIRDYAETNASEIHFGLKPHRSMKGYVELFLLSTIETEELNPSVAIFSESEFWENANDILATCGTGLIMLHSLIDFLPHGDLFSTWNSITTKASLQIFIHDYHWINPEQNLLNSRGVYTVPNWDQSVYDLDKIRRQEDHYRMPFLSEDLNKRNRSFEDFIKTAEKVVFPSHSAAKIISNNISTDQVNFSIEEHDESDSMVKSLSTTRQDLSIPSNGELNIAVIGAIGKNKGYELLASLAAHIYENNLPLRIIVVGWTMNDTRLRNTGNVVITGKYEEEDFPEIIKKYCLHCSLFLSPWPETYSYTLSLAFIHRLYPFVLNIGAQAERVNNTGYGYVIDNATPAFIASRLLRYRTKLVSYVGE